MCNNKIIFLLTQGFVSLLPNGDREPELRFYQYRFQGNSEYINQGCLD